MLNAQSSLKKLLDTLPQVGRVCWIGVRPAKYVPLVSCDVVAVDEKGLAGDRYNGRNGKRAVTLMQHEHLAAVAAMLGIDELLPEIVRRNIVVQGVNLLALKDKRFWVGDALLEYTGLCHPCSRMEDALGAGGYNAMRGHGGITARVITSGTIAVGAKVYA